MTRLLRWFFLPKVDVTKVQWPSRPKRPALYFDGPSVAELLRRLK